MTLTLSEYLTLATKAISKWGCHFMLKDDDAISFVATALMWADYRFDGRGSAYGWRLYCARFAIKTYLRRLKGRNISLDSTNRDNEPLYTMLPIVSHELLRIDLLDSIDSCVNTGLLSERQRFCILRYYLYNDTLREIGTTLKITPWGVKLSIQAGLKKLRAQYVR